MTDLNLGKEAQDLENKFFAKQNAEILKALKEKAQVAERVAVLSEVSGIKNSVILEKLVSLEINPQIMTALTLFPMVWVAWADGSVDEKERSAILKAIGEKGISEASESHQVVLGWLGEKPSHDLLDAWGSYIQGLKEVMSAEDFKEFSQEILNHSKSVAEAAGGFLGLGNKVSSSEEEALKQLSNKL